MMNTTDIYRARLAYALDPIALASAIGHHHHKRDLAHDLARSAATVMMDLATYSARRPSVLAVQRMVAATNHANQVREALHDLGVEIG